MSLIKVPELRCLYLGGLKSMKIRGCRCECVFVCMCVCIMYVCACALYVYVCLNVCHDGETRQGNAIVYIQCNYVNKKERNLELYYIRNNRVLFYCIFDISAKTFKCSIPMAITKYLSLNVLPCLYKVIIL